MSRGRKAARALPAAAALAVLALGAAPARAEVDLKFSGQISSDIRFRFAGGRVDSPYPSQYKLLEYGFSRNENRIRTKLSLGVGEKIRAVSDVELVHYGYSDVRDIDGATLRERVDPYFIEAHAAYVDIYKLLPGLDLRIGRQVVHWGASDQFNPTNNLNTLDLSDPLLFGRALANNMVRADWNPKGDWIITAVWVPIFRPAQLPRTAPLAVTQADRPAPVQEPQVVNTLATLATLMTPARIDVTGLQPPPAIENSQVGVRVAGRILGVDASLSYYHGRFGIPSPAWTVNRPGGVAEAGVVWPRMDVLGADVAGSLPEVLGGIGFWLEAAVTFPQEVRYGIYNDDPRFGGKHTPITFRLPTDPTATSAHIVMGDGGFRPLVVPSTPFFKLTFGLDYSLSDWLYMNFQYLHGFIDEFGAGTAVRLPACTQSQIGCADEDYRPRYEQRIGDYIVAGADFKLLGGRLTMRVFGVLKLPSLDLATGQFDGYRPTGVLFPSIMWQVWEGAELNLGAFIFLGDRSTKFGDPAAGASEVFLKGKFAF